MDAMTIERCDASMEAALIELRPKFLSVTDSKTFYYEEHRDTCDEDVFGVELRNLNGQ